jgi:hypothetical protein
MGSRKPQGRPGIFRHILCQPAGDFDGYTTHLYPPGAPRSLVFTGAWSTTRIPLLLFEASSMGWKYRLAWFCLDIPVQTPFPSRPIPSPSAIPTYPQNIHALLLIVNVLFRIMNVLLLNINVLFRNINVIHKNNHVYPQNINVVHRNQNTYPQNKNAYPHIVNTYPQSKNVLRWIINILLRKNNPRCLSNNVFLRSINDLLSGISVSFLNMNVLLMKIDNNISDIFADISIHLVRFQNIIQVMIVIRYRRNTKFLYLTLHVFSGRLLMKKSCCS